MKLADVFKTSFGRPEIVLVGKPEITNFEDSEGKPYYKASTKSPVLVGCSTDKDIESFETSEVYIRERDVNGDGWEFVDKNKPEKGFFMKDWVADFSKGQELVLYQAETIARWAKNNRENERIERRTSINKRIQDRKKGK